MGLHLPVAGFVPVFTETYRLLITLCSEQLGSWQKTDNTFMGLNEKGFKQRHGPGQGHQKGVSGKELRDHYYLRPERA